MTRYSIITLTLIVSLFSFYSCKEDIVLTGEQKETAIIYCLLDQSEDVHYVKINRAFIGPGNALDFAQIPDSNYFEHVDAYIYEYVGNNPTKTWYLNDTILTNKSTSGIFYSPEEKLYYFKGDLNIDATYKLKVIINKGLANEFEINGETELIKGLESGQPLTNYSPLKFINSNNQYISAAITTTSTGTGTSAIVSASLGIKIYEYYGNTLHDSVYIDWFAAESEVSKNEKFSAPLLGQTFYEKIKESVTNDPLITKRQIQEITLKLTGGSEDLKDYINANKPSNSLAQTKPSFTNLTITNDKNVVGIFSSRCTVKIEKLISSSFRVLDLNSTKELCTGSITGQLFFCSQRNDDSQQTFSCQ